MGHPCWQVEDVLDSTWFEKRRNSYLCSLAKHFKLGLCRKRMIQESTFKHLSQKVIKMLWGRETDKPTSSRGTKDIEMLRRPGHLGRRNLGDEGLNPRILAQKPAE